MKQNLPAKKAKMLRKRRHRKRVLLIVSIAILEVLNIHKKFVTETLK